MRDGAKTELARALRKSETRAEKLLWNELRSRRLDGRKFIRQAAVGPYVADFLCRQNGLIIEVDGATHSTDEDLASDHARTAHLERFGFKVLRLQNIEVLEAMDQVLMVIREVLARFPSPAPRPAERPLPQAGEVEGATHLRLLAGEDSRLAAGEETSEAKGKQQ